MNRWFAVSACGEIPPGFVAHTQLLGQELVLWRSRAGALNAWENRCPHRGVRLSIGACIGEELRCQYHAWRFASGSGQCTYIPSHPSQKPASTIRPAVFPVFEDGTFIWVNLTEGTVPRKPATDAADCALRSIFTSAPVSVLRQLLLRGYADQPVGLVDEFTLDVHFAGTVEAPADREHGLRFMLQPVTDDQTILHARLQGDIAAGQRIETLRRHNALMCALRDRAEAPR